MFVTLRKTVVVLSTTILFVHALFIPIGLVYAETISQEENIEETSSLHFEEDLIPPYLEETLESTQSDEYVERQEHGIDDEIETRSLDLFPLWGNIENGELISGNHLLPSDYEIFAFTEESRWILNDNDRTGLETDIPDNSTLRITNVGLVNGRVVDGIWKFGVRSNLSRITLQKNNDGSPQLFFVRLGAVIGTIPVDIEHRYQDNEEILNSEIFQAADVSLSRNLYYSVNQSDLKAVFSNRLSIPKWRIDTNNNHYVFQRLDISDSADSFSLLEKNQRRIVIGYGNITNASPNLGFYRRDRSALDNNSPEIKVDGVIEEERFLSKYVLSQKLGPITRGDYQLTIKYDPNIHEDMNVEKIKDTSGNDLKEYSTITYDEGETQITFSADKMKDLRNNMIEISLFGSINSLYEDLESYLVEDYLHLPLTVSTTYQQGQVKSIAETWARPFGEPIPQKVLQHTTTDELDPDTFVNNLGNRLIDDNVFVIGFEDEKEFEVLGEDSISILIKSEISGIQNTIEVPVTVEEREVSPVDPLDPDTEVDPENKPELPEEQGRLSIDFISQFDFGKQSISAQDQTYYARPQRLLNEDGMVNEKEERPNYLQISDRRVENERNGWQLSVRQHSQFKNDDGHELMGASLKLSNHQLVSAQGGKVPGLHPQNTTTLTPGATRVLVRAEGDEGTGTWIYRFGDGETASESVALTVPNGATPRAGNYSTKLTWQLSMVPKN